VLRLRYQGNIDTQKIGIYKYSSESYTEAELPTSFGPVTGPPEEEASDTSRLIRARMSVPLNRRLRDGCAEVSITVRQYDVHAPTRSGVHASTASGAAGDTPSPSAAPHQRQ
jgi:hypothetical protein